MKTICVQIISVALIALLTGCGSEKEKTYQGDLNYTLTGKGDTTLVFVHGWGINEDYWSNQVDAFSDRYQILTLDLPGHGKSPLKKDSLTIEEYGVAVATLISELDLKNVVLIGHSMSGNVNLRAYIQIPDRVVGFIGVDNLQMVGHTLTEGEAQQTNAYLQQFKNDYANTVSQYALGFLFHVQTDSLVKKRVITDIAALNPAFAIATLRALIFNEPPFEREALPQLKMPLLLIVSEGSIGDESSLQTYCKNGFKYWSIANTGHYPMIEQTEEFNARLNDALAVIAKGKVNL